MIAEKYRVERVLGTARFTLGLAAAAVTIALTLALSMLWDRLTHAGKRDKRGRHGRALPREATT